MTELTGRCITIYGQQHLFRDLIVSCEQRGVEVRFEVEEVAVHDLTAKPHITTVTVLPPSAWSAT